MLFKLSLPIPVQDRKDRKPLQDAALIWVSAQPGRVNPAGPVQTVLMSWGTTWQQHTNSPCWIVSPANYIHPCLSSWGSTETVDGAQSAGEYFCPILACLTAAVHHMALENLPAVLIFCLETQNFFSCRHVIAPCNTSCLPPFSIWLQVNLWGLFFSIVPMLTEVLGQSQLTGEVESG